MNRNIDVARRLIDAGIPTFPCSAIDKTPLTTHGFKNRTTDRAQIEAWGEQYPHCLWGIVPDDRRALAFDDDNATTHRIMAQLSLTRVATYETITPNGRHVWFRNVAGLTGQPLISLADVGLPMDSPHKVVTRIDRGYVIAGGCIRADGGRYRSSGRLADMIPLLDAVAYVLTHRDDPDRERVERRNVESHDSTSDSPSVIDAFNAAHSVVAILETHHYKKRNQGRRFLAPTSESGIPGVAILTGKDGKVRAYSHHGSDPLAVGEALDAFDLYRILEHQDDYTRAVRAAAEALGMAYPRNANSADPFAGCRVREAWL